MSTVRLYDPQELLNMEFKIASGYVMLLGGESRDRLDQEALNLAFLALVEGNVVEACFGAKSHIGSNANTPRSDRASKYANDAKKLLNEAVRSSDAVRRVAVKSYNAAFQVVRQYNKETKKLNFITRCYKWKPLRQRAEASLTSAFSPLNEAIAASS